MVRLEIQSSDVSAQGNLAFTFQYGQIRNDDKKVDIDDPNHIYIPVWLDQKFLYTIDLMFVKLNLHSSMVRLEIQFIAN